jgi:hypothetical protein
MLYLMDKREHKRDTYLQFQADVLAESNVIIKSGINLPKSYIDAVYESMDKDVREMMTTNGKYIAAIEALATLQLTARKNGITISCSALIADFLQTQAKLQRIYPYIPWQKSGVVEYYVLMKQASGQSEQVFWSYFDDRLSRVNRLLDPGSAESRKILEELRNDSFWKQYFSSTRRSSNRAGSVSRKRVFESIMR